MESHELLKKTVSAAGVKSVASDMNLSPSLIYKWCEAKGDDLSGADNPLDRLLNLCQVTGDNRPIMWLCEQVNGFFIENVGPEQQSNEMEVLVMTQRILREFSDMLDMVAQAMANDSGIDKTEARDIRAEWEDLKRVAEHFVLGCEMGVFAPEKDAS
ncbi:hypothetical protein P3T73_16970 [Kiritimatiellota bacterium B12222]|nr:hypothetical protein P3T73_16970 [Kiritimatiellota bacterium B12222]